MITYSGASEQPARLTVLVTLAKHLLDALAAGTGDAVRRASERQCPRAAPSSAGGREAYRTLHRRFCCA